MVIQTGMGTTSEALGRDKTTSEDVTRSLSASGPKLSTLVQQPGGETIERVRHARDREDQERPPWVFGFRLGEMSKTTAMESWGLEAGRFSETRGGFEVSSSSTRLSPI